MPLTRCVIHTIQTCALWLFLIIPIAVHSQSTNPTSLTQALTSDFLWTWQSPTANTRIIFNNDSTVITQDGNLWKWQAIGERAVRITFDPANTVDLFFDSAFTQFRDGKDDKFRGGRILPADSGSPTMTKAPDPFAAISTTQPTAAPVSTPVIKPTSPPIASSPSPPAATAPVKTPPDPNKMTLGRDWLPYSIHARKVLLDSIEFYCRAAVNGASAGQETVPTTIWGPVKWLMPLDQALKGLPAGTRKQREFRMANLAFPQNSFTVTIMALAGQELNDRGDKFNQITYISDYNLRVIAVQLVHTKPAYVTWKAPGPDGIRNPYYNFIEDRWNASTTNCVPYQISKADKGVTLIKTAFFDAPVLPRGPFPNSPYNGHVWFQFGRYLENVHWYLPAPLAGKLLEVVDELRKRGM